MIISFKVFGLPKPQARPRFFKRGKFMGTYSPKTDWFGLIYAEALKNKPITPLDCPIKLTMKFFMPKPKCVKTFGWHAKRPDFDNLAKAACDAITNAGIWRDDSLLCSVIISKEYSSNPGVNIDIETLIKI